MRIQRQVRTFTGWSGGPAFSAPLLEFDLGAPSGEIRRKLWFGLVFDAGPGSYLHLRLNWQRGGQTVASQLVGLRGGTFNEPTAADGYAWGTGADNSLDVPNCTATKLVIPRALSTMEAGGSDVARIWPPWQVNYSGRVPVPLPRHPDEWHVAWSDEASGPVSGFTGRHPLFYWLTMLPASVDGDWDLLSCRVEKVNIVHSTWAEATFTGGVSNIIVAARLITSI